MKLLLGPLLLVSCFFSTSQPFISIWKTDNPGDSEDDQITIPTTGEGYNYMIYWEDISDETVNGSIPDVTGNHTITFPQAGEYRVEISGEFPAITFQPNGVNEGDKEKITLIEQWGSIEWEYMYWAFFGCSNLTISALDAPDLSKVTTMSRMFLGCTSFNGDIGHWDVSNVTSFEGMFWDASLFNSDIGNWDMSNATTTQLMFHNATSFNQDISGWDVSNVSSMGDMFNGASSFNQDIGGWDISNVTHIVSMFYNASSFNQDIGGWNVSNISDFNSIFKNASLFNQNINDWDVNNAEVTYSMFEGATTFDQPLSNWNMGQVDDMIAMFKDATSFNQNIGSWDVSNVASIFEMFHGATSFNQDISGWDVGSVSNMSEMFEEATSFNQDLSQWNTSNVSNMNSMFRNATSFDQDIGNWDVGNVSLMTSMFEGAESFNQDLSGWNVEEVYDMRKMFFEASSFDQNIGDWKISSAYLMTDMLTGTNLTNNYDLTLIGWAGQTSLQQGAELGANDLTYCEGEDSRDILINDFGWIINDAGSSCPPSDILLSSNSIDENLDPGSFIIYPNPTSQMLNIDASSLRIDEMEITIHGLSGFSITGKTFIVQPNSQVRVDVDQLSSGVYFLVIKVNGEKEVKRFIKK